MERLKKNTPFKTESFESIFKMIFEDCTDGYIYKDSNFEYKYVNESFCKIFEINNLNSFIENKAHIHFSEDNKKLIKEVNATVAKELKSINYMMNFKGKNNEKILNITTSPIIDNTNFFGIISVVKDITYEEKMKEKFVSKHFQLKSLLENIPLTIFMQDKNLNFITGTKGAKQFIETGFDNINNISLDLTKGRLEDNKESIQVIEKNKSVIKEKQIFDNKGVPHWYKICKFPIKNFKNDINSLITFVENIDKTKQLEKQKESFVATLGHDLKNPTLAQIRGLELLLKGAFGELDYNQKEIIEMVLDSCRYMNGMLASLLSTYRNLDGIIKLHIEEFSFPDLVAECISEMVYVAKDKNINIMINTDIDYEIINADRIQLKRVIMNLLSNGIKYAYKDTVLKINTKVMNNFAEFYFENNSPYISEEKQKNIFSQYVTYANNYNESGSGLGLYASKRIIESHYGSMFLESLNTDINKFGFKIPTNSKPENFEKNICF